MFVSSRESNVTVPVFPEVLGQVRVQRGQKVVRNAELIECIQDILQAAGALGKNCVAVLGVAAKVNFLAGKAKLSRNTNSLAPPAHKDLGFQLAPPLHLCDLPCCLSHLRQATSCSLLVVIPVGNRLLLLLLVCSALKTRLNLSRAKSLLAVPSPTFRSTSAQRNLA